MFSALVIVSKHDNSRAKIGNKSKVLIEKWECELLKTYF